MELLKIDFPGKTEQRNENKYYFLLDFIKVLGRHNNSKKFRDNFDENFSKKLRCQMVRFIMVVPNCPFSNIGAKLSVFLFWCQIVCLPFWCQIVCFTTYFLMQNCPSAKISGAKLSYFTLFPFMEHTFLYIHWAPLAAVQGVISPTRAKNGVFCI